MQKHKVTIMKGSNFFKILNFDNDIRDLAYQFTRKFIRVDMGKPSEPGGPPPMTIFAAATRDRSEFRFHINTYEDWIKLLEMRNIYPHNYKVIDIPYFEVAKVDMPMKKGWVPRDYQAPAIDYLVADNDPKTDNKFIGMQTGRGKGLISITALSRIGERTIIIVRPGFIEKWVEELVEKLDIDIKDIMVVQGGKQLQNFTSMCVDDELDNTKIIIISNKTYQNWLKAYESFGEGGCEELGYSFPPDELFEKSKAGIRLIDEVHLDFHLNFKADLYTHTHKCISLSATLDTYDPFTKSMYIISYPPRSRGKEIAFVKYIDTYAVSYFADEDRKIATTEYGQTTYSHNAFEKSVMRNKEFYNNYALMIKSILDIGYIKRRKPGQKAIVFASTILMCSKLTEYLQKAYPDLVVKRFCEDDPESNLHDSDIRVTNMIKAGTGHDIKNLITTVLTIAMDSLQSNLQCFGRLREISGVDTEFYFLTCQTLDKHKRYHGNKIELLKPKSKSFTEIQYPKRV